MLRLRPLRVAQPFLILLLAANCSNSAERHFSPVCSKSLTPQEKQQRLTELHTARERLIHAVKTGEEKEFLALCSRDGIGIEADNYFSLTQLRAQLEGKTNLYCWLFDTQCLRRMLPELHERYPIYSFREVFSKKDGIKVESGFSNPGGVDSEEDVCHAEVAVEWEGEPRLALGLPSVVVFHFRYEDGSWKLVHISDFPADHAARR